MPYKSVAQERWAHTPQGMKALGGPAAVAEWDSATAGKSLPDKIGKNPLKSARDYKAARQQSVLHKLINK